MMLRKVMFVPKDYKEKFGDVEYILPENCGCFLDVCYADNGEPVAFEFNIPFTIKVGKRKFAKVVIEGPLPSPFRGKLGNEEIPDNIC